MEIDDFISGLNLVKDHENFSLGAEYECICLGVSAQDYPEDSEVGKTLKALGFTTDGYYKIWVMFT